MAQLCFPFFYFSGDPPFSLAIVKVLRSRRTLLSNEHEFTALLRTVFAFVKADTVDSTLTLPAYVP